MILAYENLGTDLAKTLVTDISDTIKIYTSHLSFNDLDKNLLANPKISRSCLQHVRVEYGICIRLPSYANAITIKTIIFF